MLRFKLAGVIVFLCSIVQAAPPPFPQNLDVSQLRQVPVLFNNRYMPFDTMARMVVWKVTGSEYFQGKDPVIVLLSWHFESERWAKEPVIPVPNRKFRVVAGLEPDASHYSLQSLYGDPEFSKLVASLSRKEVDSKLNPLEKGVVKARDRVTYFQKASMGSCIKILPGQEKLGVPYYLSMFNINQRATPDHVMIATAWQQMRDAFTTDNAEAFEAATSQFLEIIYRKHGQNLPLHSAEVKREIHYNTFPSLTIAWVCAALALAFGLAGVFLKHQLFRVPMYTLIISCFIVVNYHLLLRGLLAQRLPAADFFESLLLIGWGAIGFGCLSGFFSKYWSIPLTASGVGAGALFMADVLPISRYISPVKPAVLDSFWMASHVPIIIVSYAVLAIAVGIAHVQALSMAFGKHTVDRTKALNRLLIWYILVGSFLLLIGILTGAMWAAKVWGTYWKWDPKEVWSLIAFFSYMVILHVRLGRPMVRWYHYVLFSCGMTGVISCIFASGLESSTPAFLILLPVVAACYYFMFADSDFATATKTVLAFWTIIMTYVGVTYILGSKDLGKYDFGSGTTAKRTVTLGLLDLGLFAVCAIRYYRRKEKIQPN